MKKVSRWLLVVLVGILMGICLKLALDYLVVMRAGSGAKSFFSW